MPTVVGRFCVNKSDIFASMCDIRWNMYSPLHTSIETIVHAIDSSWFFSSEEGVDEALGEKGHGRVFWNAKEFC